METQMPTPPERCLVLVSLDWLRPKDPRVSLGHASLRARLAALPNLEVIPVAVAVNAPGFDRAHLLATILRRVRDGADIAIGVYIWNEPVVQWLLPALRGAGFTGRIVLGGPQISYAPAGIAGVYPDADVLIRGYGEDALAEVVRADAPRPIAGVTWRGGIETVIPASVDLAGIPSPILSGIAPVQPFMRWETQRGCIYACSFCQHRDSGARPRQRRLANQRIAAEVDVLVAGGVRDIAILDPIFHTNPAAVDILGRFADRGYTGRLSLQSRFELVDDAFLDACEGVHVRLEFGLQTIHRPEMKAIHRMNDLAAADAVIAKLHARGIPFEVSLIYGLPAQTLASFEASVIWCRQRGVPVLRAFPLMLLRGTELERDRAKWNLRESADAIPVVVSSDSFSNDEWGQMQEIADRLDGDADAIGELGAA
jgi:radical SAM superfamily enzyme YgiQ (UPF0313 family)